MQKADTKTMKKAEEVVFKSLLTLDEYTKLLKLFEGKTKIDVQTNHYFDTTRFSLKALDTSLKVCERNDYLLVYKRKKGYAIDKKKATISNEEYAYLLENGKLNEKENDDRDIPYINDELAKLIKDQKLVNFLNLYTDRRYLPYESGTLNIDKSEYLGVTDYEIEYSTTAYHQGKDEFIKLISEQQIQYKKSDQKLKRAYTRLKEIN